MVFRTQWNMSQPAVHFSGANWFTMSNPPPGNQMTVSTWVHTDSGGYVSGFFANGLNTNAPGPIDNLLMNPMLLGISPAYMIVNGQLTYIPGKSCIGIYATNGFIGNQPSQQVLDEPADLSLQTNQYWVNNAPGVNYAPGTTQSIGNFTQTDWTNVILSVDTNAGVAQIAINGIYFDYTPIFFNELNHTAFGGGAWPLIWAGTNYYNYVNGGPYVPLSISMNLTEGLGYYTSPDSDTPVPMTYAISCSSAGIPLKTDDAGAQAVCCPPVFQPGGSGLYYGFCFINSYTYSNGLPGNTTQSPFQMAWNLISTFQVLYGFTGDMTEFWFAPGQFVDLSQPANIAKFITSQGIPANLGSNGQAPTGIPPYVYFSGGANTFAKNLGTGGTATLSGPALQDAKTSPYQQNNIS